MTEPTKEVATTTPSRAPVQVPLVGQLNDLDQAYRYAQALAQSNLLPKDLFGKPANVLAIILYGQQLNLTPMQSIQSIYVVNGRPQMAGQLWLSKVREAGHKVKVSDHTAKSCTVTIVRGDTDEDHTETFTWEDAERAKLTKKDVWQSWPKRMLLWRAVSNCATVICPEVALGFGAEDPEPVQERPTLAQVAAERVDHSANAATLTPMQVGHGENEAESDPLPATAEPEQDPTQPDADMLAELREIEAENGVPEDQPAIDFGGES